jgi:Ca2+-binding EF-hand superfamily protein
LNWSQVHDILNKYDNGSGQLSYPEFRRILHRKVREADLETNYKESFRVFSKANTEHITCRRLFDFKLFLKLSRWKWGKGGQNTTFYLRPITLPSTQQVDD